jgi:heme-degrading monooxygenase HmoA
MYSRVTSLEIDTLRIGTDDALSRYRSEVLPRLREEEGFEGVLVLATHEGAGLVISFWATEADARRGTDQEGGLYAETIARFTTIFRAPPGREQYEVVLADAPALAAVG